MVDVPKHLSGCVRHDPGLFRHQRFARKLAFLTFYVR